MLDSILSIFKEGFYCIKCGKKINKDLFNNSYRKKCPYCFETNYKFNTYKEGLNYSDCKVVLGNREERQKNKAKWDLYYNTTYKVELLIENYGKTRVSNMFKYLKKKFNGDPSIEDVKWSFLNEDVVSYGIEKDVPGLIEVYRNMLEIKLDKQIFVEFIFWNGVYQAMEEMRDILVSGGKDYDVSIDFDDIVDNSYSMRIMEYFIHQFEKKGISINDLRKSFDQRDQTIDISKYFDKFLNN